MSTLFKIVGYLLFLALVVWISMELTVTRQALVRPIPSVTTNVNAFVGSTELPAETISATFEHARQSMAKCFVRGNTFSTTARISDWVAFGLTAGVTLLAGYLGHPVPKTSDPANTAAVAESPSKDAQLRQFSKIVGAMAAFASIATAASGKFESSAKSLYDRGDKIRLAIANFEKEVQEAPSAAAARRVLDDFNAQVLRLE